MYHGFSVSCSSEGERKHTQSSHTQKERVHRERERESIHTHTHTSTHIFAYGNGRWKKSTPWCIALFLLCSRLAWKQTSLETFPSESFIRLVTSEHRIGWRKCLSSAQWIGTLPRTTRHQGTLNRSSSSFYLSDYSRVWQLSQILVFCLQSCTNMTNRMLGLSRWI